MRQVYVNEITEEIAKMCVRSNCYLNKDIRAAVKNGMDAETDKIGKSILKAMIENADIAQKEEIPICQDTGMAVVFLEVGQDIHITGGDLYDSVNKGIRKGYVNLRKSVVSDPIKRKNTEDNTPAVIHTDIVSGDKLKITIAPKGFGSENMSALKMLKPSDGREGVVDFVVETIKIAGSNPCPPVVVGVGIGGTAEMAQLLSKRALCRDIYVSNADEYYKGLEEELLSRINKLKIGPQGLGGDTTALGVNIETYPTHIAGLPVAVNIGCHVTRHQTVII